MHLDTLSLAPPLSGVRCQYILISPQLLWWASAESHYNMYDHSTVGYVIHAHCIALLYSFGNKITTTTTTYPWSSSLCKGSLPYSLLPLLPPRQWSPLEGRSRSHVGSITQQSPCHLDMPQGRTCATSWYLITSAFPKLLYPCPRLSFGHWTLESVSLSLSDSKLRPENLIRWLSEWYFRATMIWFATPVPALTCVFDQHLLTLGIAWVGWLHPVHG